ncbi:MAG: gamma-glutamyltransferase [Deltaproteobacteria bacterium]|nr:gamma-glutamyltransferase [Deltaproteobacteria bacterium]
MRLALLGVGVLAVVPIVACSKIIRKDPAVTLIQPVQSGRSFDSFQSRASHGMVATAHPEATRAGLAILKEGGNAVDALTAVSFALSVVVPHHAGLGGGGFAVIRMDPDKKARTFDFREMAPGAAHRDMFLVNGKADPRLSTEGALSVAVPGFVAGILQIQEKHGSGRFTLEQLLAPAIRLADEGFEVTPALSKAIEKEREKLGRFPSSRSVFLKPDGTVPQAGERIVQKDLAETLRRIVREGRAGFYQGVVAEKIVRSLRRVGGNLTAEDLSNYQVRERDPIVGTYRGLQVYSMPPPSSGGIVLVQMLNMLEGYDLASSGPQTDKTIHLMSEVERLAYADRALYLGDPDFFDVPVGHLTGKEYAALLRQKIGERAGDSEALKPKEWATQMGRGSTTHFSVVDQWGNAIATTLTINLAFGSGIVAEGTGIVLNDEMDDFSAQPGVPNEFGLVGAEANAVQPHKRPLSSMTPTLVLNRKGELVMSLGAAGGSRIITGVLQTIVNSVDYSMAPLNAVAAARVHHQWLPNEIFHEEGGIPEVFRGGLQGRGHKLTFKKELGRVQLVAKSEGQWVGIADPRDEGSAMGY